MEFIDLKKQYMNLKSDIDLQINKVLTHGRFILGPEVELFESALCEYLGVRHAITCGNGTDALQLVYMAHEIGIGDAVFCPNVTFIASIEPACMLGAIPVFCDISRTTYNICPDSLENQINNVIRVGKHTPKAVVAVDFLGNPAEYDAIRKICDKYQLLLIEDAAQSFGASYKNKLCGSIGDVSCTSFFPAKPLGCYGDGGAVFLNDDGIAEIIRSICVHGKGSSKYDNVRIGMNSRLDTLQAAILLVKLEALKNNEIHLRQKISERYNQAFSNYFTTPYVADENISSYAQYALLAESKEYRDSIVQSLVDEGIPCMIYYPTPQHLLKVFDDNPYAKFDFSNSIKYCETTFSLPMHPYLSEEEQDIIISTVLKAVEKKND